MRECEETDIQLVSGQTASDGRIEVCSGGLWGSVCHHKWDYLDAAVVCRQLQYNGSEFFLIVNPVWLTFIIHQYHILCLAKLVIVIFLYSNIILVPSIAMEMRAS